MKEMNFHKIKEIRILIKITQSLYPVASFLQIPSTVFDETLHVGQVCPKEGFCSTGTSGF